MKKTIVILILMVLTVACYSQNNVMDYTNEPAPALEDYLYLVKGGTSDRNTSKLQFQQNLIDSLGVVRAIIALQQIEIDNNTDSIAANELRITANELDIANNVIDIGDNETRIGDNESQIITDGVNISDNSVSIVSLQSDVSALEDSIAIYRLLFDSVFSEVALLWDTIEYYHPPTPEPPESDTLIWNTLWLEDFETLAVQNNLSASNFRDHIGQENTLTSSGMGYDNGDGHGAHYNVDIIEMDSMTNGAGAGTKGASRVWRTSYTGGEYDANHGHQFWITMDDMTDSVLTGVVGVTFDIAFIPGMDFNKEVKLMGFSCDSSLAGDIVSTEHPAADNDSTTAEGIGVKNALLGLSGETASQYEWYTGRTSIENDYAKSSPRIGNSDGVGLWEFDNSDTIWYHIAMITMYNSDNVTADGEVSVFINGVCHQSWNTSWILSDITREIETIIFYTFYGGGDSSYDAPNGMQTFYDHLRFIKMDKVNSTYTKEPGVYFEIGEVVGFPGYPRY